MVETFGVSRYVWAMRPADRLYDLLPVNLWKAPEPEAFMDPEERKQLALVRRRNDAIMRGQSGPF